MARNLENRLAELEDTLPRGYSTRDANGKPVIQSDLPALEWYTQAMALLRSKGHQKEKALLIADLVRSEGPDNSGGSLYEMVLAMAEPDMARPDPHVKDRFFKPFGCKARRFAFSRKPNA